LLDNEKFQRDYLDESYIILGLKQELGGAGMPLVRPGFKFHPHQIVGIRWMVDMEESLAQGGLLADECGTGKVSVSQQPHTAYTLMMRTDDGSNWGTLLPNPCI
jgi:hypothetical protein